jgi:UDP-glucose 4-epimerase
LSARRVIVTGAAGFVGRHASRLFAAQGWHVIGIGHGTWSLEDARAWGVAEWHAADITFDALVNTGPAADAIVHCAGGSSVGHSMSHPLQDFQRSCSSISAALEYARLHAPAARVVYTSSAAVYGQKDLGPIEETATIAPVSPYGLHKSFGEALCQTYATHYGIACAVLRFFSVYGRGLRKQLLWDACSKAARGELQFGGTGQETRDWLEVTDAAVLLLRAVDWASAQCPVINGGTGESPTVREVLQELLNALNVSAQPRFSGVVRAGDPLYYRAAIARAAGLGWQAQVPWRTGVRAYADWYRAGAL